MEIRVAREQVQKQLEAFVAQHKAFMEGGQASGVEGLFAQVAAALRQVYADSAIASGYEQAVASAKKADAGPKAVEDAVRAGLSYLQLLLDNLPHATVTEQASISGGNASEGEKKGKRGVFGRVAALGGGLLALVLALGQIFEGFNFISQAAGLGAGEEVVYKLFIYEKDQNARAQVYYDTVKVETALSAKRDDDYRTRNELEFFAPEDFVLIPDETTTWFDQIKGEPKDKYGEWAGPVRFMERSTRAERTFYHWHNKRQRTVYMRVAYKAKDRDAVEKKVSFNNATNARLSQGRTYRYTLPEKYYNFRLNVIFPDGDDATLTPDNNSYRGIRVAVDEENGKLVVTTGD